MEPLYKSIQWLLWRLYIYKDYFEELYKYINYFGTLYMYIDYEVLYRYIDYYILWDTLGKLPDKHLMITMNFGRNIPNDIKWMPLNGFSSIKFNIKNV